MAKTWGAAGRPIAALGLAIGLGLAAGCGSSAASSASDPACTGLAGTLFSLSKSLTADAQTLQSDASNPALAATDATTLAGDVGSARSSLDALLSKSTNASVKAQLQDLDNAAAKLADDLGPTTAPSAGDVAHLLSAFAQDSAALSGLCAGGKS